MGAVRKTARDPIGAALFGETRQAVLRLFFSNPGERFYQRQVVRQIGLGSGAVQRDLERLTHAGILTRAEEGRQTYYQANRQCPVFEDLHGLIRKTFGAAWVIQSSLRTIAGGIRFAFIYGSMASGKATSASDVDVMIVGDDISLDEVVSKLAGAQRDLRREVNPSVYRVAEFCRKLAEGRHFISSVVAGPKIYLIGDEDELTGLAQVRVAQGARKQPAGDRGSTRRR